jgi:Transposase DDE domain
MDIVTLFCDVDDFCIKYIATSRTKLADKTRRNREGHLSKSEIMTILIYFHASNYRNFKHYYLELVCKSFKEYFPNLVSYNRFLEIGKKVALELSAFFTSRLEPCTGISFIDSTPIAVCNNKRITRNKVFEGVAAIGKSTMGWFYGFKLHLIVNDRGGLLKALVTPGNVDDRALVPKMTDKLFGKMFGDKGYIKQELFEFLLNKGITLITGIKKNMKNKIMDMMDKILLRKRSIIETINDQLKNISQIEHTRHRSCTNFMINLLCGLIAYTYRETKPSIKHVHSIHDTSLIPS